jgi:hypothetical protein
MTYSRCWPNGTLGGILYEGREQSGDQQHPAHDGEAGSDQEQAVVPRLGSRAAVGHARRPGPAAAAGALLAVRDMQDGALDPGCLRQFGENARR